MPSRPPDIIVFGAVFIAILFILGGNIYTLIRTPPAIAGNPAGGAPILIAPGYYASKYVFQPGYATRLLILGMILAGVAFLVFSYMFTLKIG
ncbi:MAG: hypothetical protein ACXAAR_10020 [Candidatus Thorarchaeota archaeon]|jgi:hypothetical protein